MSGMEHESGSEWVRRIVCDTLGRSEVGDDDDFFDLGGSSLSLAIIATRIDGLTGRELDVTAFLRDPRISSLVREAWRAGPDIEKIRAQFG